MSLEGAKFICLDEAGNQGEIVLAKGRKFTVGYYVSCDFVLADERAKGVHCEIECDAFGRVTIRNLSPDKPILVNGSAVEIKRILLNNSKLSILDKEYLWLFPKSSSNEFEDLPSEAASTPQKHVGMPEQPPNSCPDFKLHREVPKRFTVHNFAYCIQSDEEGNTSTDSNDDNANEDITQTNKSPKDDDSQTQKDLESNELINQKQEDNNETETKDKHNRSVTPEPKAEEDNTTKTLMETPKMNLINYTKDKTNKSTEKKKKQLLTTCHQSDIVITSFSPRETGVKIEKSFATIMKPKVLVTKTPATPKSAYSTPKGEIPNNDVGMEDDKELMTFHTPSTSKKGTSTASTKVLKNSSMHLIDLTTPHKLRPASPFLKSALKASAKKNVTQNAGDKTQSGKLASEEQLGLSALPSTPALSETSNNPLETPNSVISVSSSTDSSSIIEVTSDGSNMGITPGSATGLTTPIKATNLAGACTPKRTPQSLMKRALLTSAKKQNTTPQRNANTTGAGTTTPRRESINRIPLRSNLALLRSPSTPQASTGDKSSSQLARRHSMSTPTRKNISAISRFDSPTTSTLAPASPSSSARFATSRRTSLNPISAARALPTSTPVAGSSNNPALRTRAACKTSPLHKVRKSVGGMPLTSHISKARRSIVLPASTSKITSIKEKSPQQVMSGRLVSRARKSLCVTPISARSRNMVTAAKTPPHPPSSILKDRTTQSARKPEKKAVLFADKKPADIGDVDNLSRTFIIDSDDEENTNNGNPADKPKDATFSPEKETKETVSEKDVKNEQPAIEIPVDVEEITDLTEDNSQTEVEKSKENNEKLENNDKKEDNSQSELENAKESNEKLEDNDKKESIVTEESFADIINDSQESQEVNKLTETIEIPDSPKESSQTESQESFADVVEEIIQDNTTNETNSKEITKDAATTEDNTEKSVVIESGFGEESTVEIIETSNKETKSDETKEAEEVSNKYNGDNETNKQNTEEDNTATIETPSSTQDEVITSETIIAETKSIAVQEDDDKIGVVVEEEKSKTEYKPIVEDITLEGSLIEKEANVSKQPLYEDITLEGSLIEDKVKNEDIKQETTEGVTSTAKNTKLLETTEQITKEFKISEIPKTSEVLQEQHIEIASNTQKPQSSTIEEKSNSTIDELELKETKSANVEILEESINEPIDNPEILERAETSVIGDDLENTNKLLEEIEDVLNKSDEIKQKHLIELEEANQESDNPLTEEFESEKLTQESKEKTEEAISSVSDDKNQQKISTESNALSKETDTKSQVEQKIQENAQTSEKEEKVEQDNSRKEDAESQEEDIPTDNECAKQEENVDQATLKNQDENIPAEKSSKDVEDNNVSGDTIPQTKENTFEEEYTDSTAQLESDVNGHQICKTDIVPNEEVADVIVSSTEEVIINEETQNKTETLEIVERCEKNNENLETSEEVTVSEESSNTEQKTEPSEIDIESEKHVEKLETSIQSSDNVISEIEDSNKNKESSEIISQEIVTENEPEIIQEKSTEMVTEIVQDNEKTEQEIETKLAQEKKPEENVVSETEDSSKDTKLAQEMKSEVNVVSETEDSSKEKQIEEKCEEKIAEIKVLEKDETIEPQTALGVQNENQTEVSQVAEKASDIKPEVQMDKSKENEVEISSIKKKTENSASFTPRRSTRRASQSAETSQASTELSFTPRRSARRASMSAESNTTYTPTKRTTRRASLSVVNETPLTPKAITKRRPSISLDNDEISKPSTSKTPRAKTPRKQIEQRMVIPEEMEEVVGAAIIEEVEEENAEIIENVEKQQNQEIKSLAKAESVKLKEEDKEDLEKVTADRLATEETGESLVLETSTQISEEIGKSKQNVIASESKQDDAEGSTHQTEINKTEPVVVNDNTVSSKKEEESINASDIPVKTDEKMENDLKEVDVVDKVNLKDNIATGEETSKEHIAIEKSMEAKEIQEDLAESADDKEEHQQKTPTKAITVEAENSPINPPVAKKSVTIIAESPKTPLMSGMRELLKTPKTEVQTPRLEGIRDLVRSPKETHENEEEEVEKLAVIANLTKTPKTTSSETVLEQETLTPKTKKQIKILADSPKTPLMSGMRELLKTPKTEVQTPRLGGIRDLVRSPKDTNENEEETEKLAVVADLIKTPKVLTEDKEISTPKAKKHVTIEAISPQTPLMAGMRELLKTPKCEMNTPKLEGIRDLVKTPKSKTENEQEETEKLAVVAELVKTPQVEVEQMPSSSHKNDNLQGVKELLKTPKSCNTPRFKGMRELMQTPKLSSTPLMAGVKELLDSPAVQENPKDVSQENTEETPCSTATKTGPNLKGVKELMKTPKSCSTPRLKGIRELMQTPKMSSTPLMGGLKELMDSPAQNKEEELDKYLRTPTAKNIMIPTMPSSAVIEKSSDSIEISTEYDLNATNEGETAHLEDLFKTPVASRFAERITASYYGEEGEEHDETLEKFNENKNETLQDTLSKSAEEAFDKLVGQETQIQTPIRKVYPRKSFALQTPQAQSPFSAADVLSDLPKTDVEEWIETLDQAEPPSILECDDEGGDSTQQKVEDEDEAIESLKVEEDDEESSVLEESLADKDKQDTISNDSVIPETCTKVYLPEKTLINTTTASLTNTDTKDPLRDTNQKPKKEKETRPVTPIDAEISGINLLDQTVDSVQDEPSILEEPLVVEEPSIFEEPLMVSDNESEADNTINKGDETEVLEVSQDDANDLSEPLMVSDSEDLNQSQEKEINNEVETKERGNEESNLDVEKSMIDKDSNISLSEDPLQTKDKEPESSVILVDDEKSLIEINESIKQQESLIETHSVGDESLIIKDSSTKESEIKENKNGDAEILSTSQESDILGEESLQLEDSPTKETIKDKQKEADISLTVQTKEANEDLEAEVDAAETVVIVEDISTAKSENQEAKEISIKETKVLSNESDDIFVDTSVTEIFEETTATNDEHTAESHEITEPMKEVIESDIEKESIKKSSPQNIEKDAVKKSSPQLDHECQDIFMDSSNIDESFAGEETNVESESAKPETSTEISKQENNSDAVVDDIKENQNGEENSDDIVKEADTSEKTSEIDDVEEKQQIIKEIDASQSKSDSESVITEESQKEICEQSSLISEEKEQISAEEIETEPEQINQVKCLSTNQTISTTSLENTTTSDKTVESEIDNKLAETSDEQKTQDIEISTAQSKELQQQSVVVSSEEDNKIDESIKSVEPIEKDKNQENIAPEPLKKSSNELNEQPIETMLNEASVSNEEISPSKSEINRIEKDDTIFNKNDGVKQTDVVPSSTEEENISTTEQKSVVSLSTEESKSLLPEHEETTSSDLEAKEGTSGPVEIVPSTLTECEESKKSGRNDSEETASIELKMEETTTEEEIVYDTEVVSSTEEQSIETEKELPKEIEQSGVTIMEDKASAAGEVISELEGEIVSLTEEESKETAIVSRNEFEESASIALEEKEENSVSDKSDVEIVSSTAESKEIEQISLKESETSASVVLKVEETAAVEAITEPSEVVDSKEVESKEVDQVAPNETEESASIILKVEEAVSEEVLTNESEVSDSIPLEMETTSAEKFTLNPQEEEVPSTVEEPKLAEQESVIESEISGAVVSEVEETASEAKLAEKESVIESEVSGAVVLEVDETISEAKLTEKESVIESEVSDAVVLQVEETANESKLAEKESVIESEASGAVVSKIEETASDEISSTVDECVQIEKVPTNDSDELSVISEAKENATEEKTIKEKISDENETTKDSTKIDEVIVSKSEESPSTASKVEDHSTEEKVDSEISEEKDVAKHGEEVSSTAEESKQREQLTTSESVESTCVLLTDEAESNNKNENSKPDEIVTSTAVENKDNESIISKESVAPTEIVKSYDFEIKIKDTESQQKEPEDINKKEATNQRKRKGSQSTEASSANVEIPLRDEKFEEAEVESPEYEKIEKVEKTSEEVPRSSRRKRTVSESSQDSVQGDEHGSSSRRERRKVVKKTTCEKLEDVKEEEIIQLDKVKDEKPKRKRTASESSQGSVKDDDISTTTRRTRRRVQKAPVEETVVEQKEEIEELAPKETQVPSPSKQNENNENLIIETTKDVTAESAADDVNMQQNEHIPTDVTSTEEVKREVAELVDNKQEDVTQVMVEVQELANENQDENKPEEVKFEQPTPAEDVSVDNNVQTLEDEIKEVVPNEDLGEPLKPTVIDKDLIEAQSTKIKENDTQSSQISEVKEENETPSVKAEVSEAKDEETKSKLSDIIEMPEPLNTESVTEDLQEVESIAVDEPKELPVKRGRRKPTISESSQGSVHDEEPATHIRKPRRKVQKAPVEEVVLEEPPTDREHNAVDVPTVDENVLPTTEGNIDLETKPLKDSENISTTVSEEVDTEIVTLEEVKEQTMRRGRRKPTVSESSQGSVHDDDSSRTRKGRRKVQKAPIEEIVLEENEPHVEIKEPEETKEEAEVKEESKQILIAAEEQKVEEEVKEIIVETEEHKDVTEKSELKEVEAAVVEEVMEEHEDVSEKTELNVVEATVVEEVIEISNEQVSVSNKEDLTPESHSEISALENIQTVQEENIESKVENEKQQEMPENVVEDRIEDEESKEAVVKRTRRKRDLKDTALEEPTTSRKARRKNQTAMTTTEESIPESVPTEEVPETKLSTIEDLKVNDEPVVETADEQPLDEVSATSNKEEHHEDEVSTKHVGKRGRRKFELEEISNETTANAKETIHATRRGGRHKTIVTETAATEIPKVRNTTRTRKTPLEQSSEISNDDELALYNENIPEMPTAEDAISPDIPKARNTSRNRETPIDHPKMAVQNEDQKESVEETPAALEVPETIAKIEKPKTDNVVIIKDSPDENKPSNDKLANSPEEEHSADSESKDDDKSNTKRGKRNRTASENNKDLVLDVKPPKRRAKQHAEEVHEENQNKADEPQVTEVSNEKEVAEKPLKTSRRRGAATHHEEEHHEELPTKSRRRRARHEDCEEHHTIENVNEPMKLVEEPSVSEVRITEVNLEFEEVVEKTTSPQEENQATGRRARRNVTNEEHHLDESETKGRAAAKHIEQDNEENTTTSRRRVGRRKHVGEGHEAEEEPVTHTETTHKRRNVGRRKQEEDHHDDVTSEEGKQLEVPDVTISQQNIDKDKQDHDDNEASTAKHVAEEEIKHVESIETTSKRRHIGRKKHEELEDQHNPPKHDSADEQQHIEITDMTTKRHVGRKKHDTETHHEKDNVANIISVDIENQTEHSPEETKKVRGRRKKIDHPEEEVTTSLSPKTKHRGRKRKESHNDTHDVPIEKEELHVPEEKSTKEPEIKLDIVSAHTETPQRAAPRGRKASAIEHITAESHEAEDTPGRRARNVPQRRAATAYHNYDETSDSEVKTKTTKKKTDSPRKSLEVTKTSPTATITSAPVINASPSPSSTASATTARGRTRKPTAKVQQFLEEERAKAETPKKRGLLAAAAIVDGATTPQRTPARRGRKASTIDTEIEGTPVAAKGRGRGKHTVITATHAKEEHGDEPKHEPEATAIVVEEKEVELHTTPPQAQPAAKGRRGRKAKINEEEHQKSDEPPAKKSPLELEIEKQNSSPSVDAPTPPTRVAGRRNAAAAAKARIEEDALAAAAIDPPKKARARKAPTKVSTPIISATPDTEVHSSEVEEEKVTKTKSSPSKREHRLASASTLEGAEDLEDHHIGNESTDKPVNKRGRKAIAHTNTDSLAVPVKRSRKAKTAEEATETNTEEDTKPIRGRGRGRKNVHFDEHGEEPKTTATTSSHQNTPDIETPVVVESSEPVKRGTRTRRK